MKFSIITPTYKRADKLSRAITSVLQQTHTDWEMVIVNDSPDDTSYSSLEKTFTDPRIVYLKNKENEGVNYSRNRGLDSLSKDSDWVIFLDDDDWFSKDTLETFTTIVSTYPDKRWFITNRAYENGTSLTSAPRNKTAYSYAYEYLILKRIQGDVTQCIQTSLLSNIQFSKKIKQGEEWLFFFQVGLHEKMYYVDQKSTLTDGYDKATGLNFRKKDYKEKQKIILNLLREGCHQKLLNYPSFNLYILIRLVRALC
ncbi:hypothetical protein AUJ77_00310 [Candidatus Nomurabacteria bacterium CG1_02_43_90]|uniref:Glycosyltransferase 2-like domain-containing protein n=1 Tax=Candidatus Nomurabacteria bacterium CG1_02_43_90 TaxID=1805281 RepID=A0A1J4VAD6_9BACT|nr:MAG: hypothetical protein AUJ77_00310 [Candidatus Nomurabacteria bacterium CG1_02_43_90]